MNTHISRERRLPSKLVAIALTVAVLMTMIVTQVGSTMALPADIVVTLQSESGIPASLTMEKGQTKTRTVSYLNDASSSNTQIATVSITKGTSVDNLRVTGVKAGVVGIAFGTLEGVLMTELYQVTDSANISKYTVKTGGEILFNNTGPEYTRDIPVIVLEGTDNIAWRSLNTEVATVNQTTKKITPIAKGTCIVIGEFTDKWGIQRDIHLLVGVGVELGAGNNLSELMELIKKGEWILSQGDDSPYTADSLANLLDKVNSGKDVVNSPAPTNFDINNAITNLKNAINGLKLKDYENPKVIKGKDGNHYLPVGDPDKVFMIVNPDGTPKHMPPKYVYNPAGTPGDGNDKPAYLGSDGEDVIFWVEGPENIFRQVASNGTLKHSPIIWGGANGKPGGGDDEYVKEFGGEYWVDRGQNVFQKVLQPQNPNRQLGPLTGGGISENPTASPVTPIYKHTDGKYYVGPIGSGPDAYYFGDSLTTGVGDGKVQSHSTPPWQHPTDDKFFLSGDKMVSANEAKNIVISPKSVSVIKGGTQTFAASVYTYGGSAVAKAVTWSVSPAGAGTSISSAGVLTIGTNENNTTLTVRASLTDNLNIFDTATVVVTDDSNAIKNVVLSPTSATVAKGNTQNFTATVYRNDNSVDPAGVTWSLSPATTNSSITGGLLTIGANETNATLTVTARSITNTSIFATATVTIKAGGGGEGDVNFVTISPLISQIDKGAVKDFTAKVYLNNGNEDLTGVTWSVTGGSGTSIDQNGRLTVGANDNSATITVTATSKKDSSKSATLTITLKTPTGVPGLDDTPVGGTIVIDGIEWIKVMDGMYPASGQKYSLLLMSGVIGGPSVKYADTYDHSKMYNTSELRDVINYWYQYTNLPVLKANALKPHIYPSPTASFCFGETPSGELDVAFAPMKADIYPRLSTHQLENGFRWWTQTMTKDYSMFDGYFEYLRPDGSWWQRHYDDNYGQPYLYARPVIYVKR